MDDNRKFAIESLLRGVNTNHFSDALMHGEILRAYKESGDTEAYNFVLALIMQKRKEWGIYIQNLQNKWQYTGKNNHHDSFELRESYIAPHVDYKEESEFEKRAASYNRLRKPEIYAERERQLNKWKSL